MLVRAKTALYFFFITEVPNKSWTLRIQLLNELFFSILKINDSLPNLEKDFMCINVLSINQKLQVCGVRVVKFPLQ